MRTLKPNSDYCIQANGAFLSGLVMRVICRRCGESTPVAASLNQAFLLWKHRGHLGDVTVDVWFNDLGSDRISEMQLRLMPLEIQIFPMK
jgi:hypothetical protein